MADRRHDKVYEAELRLGECTGIELFSASEPYGAGSVRDVLRFGLPGGSRTSEDTSPLCAASRSSALRDTGFPLLRTCRWNQEALRGSQKAIHRPIGVRTFTVAT